MALHTYKQALESYHTIYDNDVYKAIRRQVVMDSASDEGADPIIDFMNMLIDTCLECCGATRYRGSHVALARTTIWLNLKADTIEDIHRYLLTFQQRGIIAAGDFAAIVNALVQIAQIQSQLKDAIVNASVVHSWQGHAAYHLLSAVGYLMTSTELLLDRTDNESYLSEKLSKGLNSLDTALNNVAKQDNRHVE